jgi:hypothetical protein
MPALQVIMKGINARPVPIIIRGDLEQGIDTSTVRVDSQYLSLDTRYPWQTISDGPDLEVGAGMYWQVHWWERVVKNNHSNRRLPL